MGYVTDSAPARTTTGRIPSIFVAGLLVVIAANAATLVLPSLASPRAAPSIDLVRSRHSSALGEAGGVVPDGTTVFDDDVPGVARLNPALLGALRKAATDAAKDRVQFFVDSGW